MSVFADLDAELAETAMRLESARLAVSMLGDLLDELGVWGFDVDVIQSEVDGAVLHVALRIIAPADPITTGPAVDRVRIKVDELIEYVAPIATPAPVPEFSSEDVPDAANVVQAAAPVIVPAIAPVADDAAPVPSTKKGTPWTSDEDALFIEMKNAGYPVRAIAERLERPSDACNFRWSKVLKPRLDAQRADAIRGAPVDLAALAKFDVLTLPPADGFPPALDTRLRDYMAQDMGLGGVAALFKMPRAKVEARWEQMKAALAQVSA